MKKAEDFNNGIYGEFDCAYDAEIDLLNEHREDNCWFFISALKAEIHPLTEKLPENWLNLNYKFCFENFCKNSRWVDILRCPINQNCLRKFFEIFEENQRLRHGGNIEDDQGNVIYNKDDFKFCDTEFLFGERQKYGYQDAGPSFAEFCWKNADIGSGNF